MSQIPSDLFFRFPAAAYLFLGLIPLYFFFWHLFQKRQKTLAQFADVDTLSEVHIPRSSLYYWSKCAALSLAWMAATFALMQPEGNAHYPSEHQPPSGGKANQRGIAQELILLIDTSQSMAVKDSRNGMSRLDYAKDIADQIVSQLRGEMVALYAFTSEVTSLSPATLDYLFVRLMLRQMRLNEGDITGTDIRKALIDMHKYVETLPATRQKLLVLMSDGGDTALEDMQGDEREKALSDLLETFDDAAALNLQINTIGMGSLQGGEIPEVTYQGSSVSSSLQPELLQRLALRVGGSYFEANNMTTPELANRIIQKLHQQASHANPELIFSANPSNRPVVYDRYFQLPLGIAFLLILAVLFWPDIKEKK